MSDYKCQAAVPGNFKHKVVKRDAAGNAVTRWDTASRTHVNVYTEETRVKPRMCAKQAVRHVRVTYSSVPDYLQGRAPADSTFSFCPDCWERLRPDQGPAAFTWAEYSDRKVIARLWGTVGTVAEVQLDARADRPTGAKAAAVQRVKDTIRRMMRQKNTAALTAEEWHEAVHLAVDEAIVREVMDS